VVSASVIISFGAFGILVWLGWPASVPQTPATKRLIVVLPFVDLSQESLAPMADALAEEIGARLASRAPAGLGIIARTSAMGFKDSQANAASPIYDGRQSSQYAIIPPDALRVPTPDRKCGNSPDSGHTKFRWSSAGSGTHEWTQ